MFINPKDIPFAVALTALLLLYCVALEEWPRPKWRTMVALGAAGGLALGTRVGAVISALDLAVPLALWTAAAWRREGVKTAFAATAGGIVRCSRLCRWHTPSWRWFGRGRCKASRIRCRRSGCSRATPPSPTFCSRASRFRPSLCHGTICDFSRDHAAGEHARRPRPGRRRRAALVGDGRGTRRVRRTCKSSRSPPPRCFPSSTSSSPDPPLNGLRHFLFVLPPLAVLAAVAVDRALTWLGAWRRSGLVALLLLSMTTAVARMCAMHPLEYIYFNDLSGGLRAAAAGFNSITGAYRWPRRRGNWRRSWPVAATPLRPGPGVSPFTPLTCRHLISCLRT